MHFYKVFRASLLRFLAVLLLVALLIPAPAFALDSEDSQIFISGFNAYQRKDYKTAIQSMSDLLKKYPDTPLRDMAIFWLARANYKVGRQQDAAKYMAQFFREYPQSPLKETVEEGLVDLAQRYEKGEPLDVAPKAEPKRQIAETPSADKAAAAKVAAEKAAAERAATERAAAEKAALLKAAAEKAAAERAAAEKAAIERAAAEQAAADKAAAETAAAARVAAERVAAEKAAAAKVAADRAATEKAAAERAAAERAAAERAASERAASERAASERATAERATAERATAERAAAERAAAERAASERAAAERAAAERAAAERAAAERAAAERAAAERAAAERAAAERAAAERAAAERVAAERVAAEPAGTERPSREKSSAERAAEWDARKEAERAAQWAAAERAVEKAAAEAAARKAAEQAAERAERSAADRSAADRSAVEKAAAEKAAAERLTAETIAAEKAASERAAAEKIAAKAAAERAAAEKAAAEKAAAEKSAAEKTAVAKAAPAAPSKAKRGKGRKEVKPSASEMRATAIAAYKEVVDKYPGTAAAANASAKLGQMGIEYPPVQKAAPAPATAKGENAQVFNLEVAQFADVDVQLGSAPETEEVGKRFSIPFEIVNLGNGVDSFYLESGFPPEYNVHFAAAATPETPINSTPSLATWEKFRVVAVGNMPRGNIDGQKGSFPVKVVSSLNRDVSQSRELRLVSSAPLLRAVVKTDKTRLLPGEKISYRVDLLNIGSAAARGVTVRLNYPPQYEPVSYLPAGFKQETKAAMVLDGLQLRSGESTEVNVTFQLKEEALAQQELFLRADVINNELDKKDSFLSATSVVQSVSGVTARTTAEKLVVIPGQVISVPLIVTNTGNMRELFAIRAEIPSNVSFTFFQDLNRDGKKQVNEPIINHVGPLSPKEESYVVLEIATPSTANDGAVTPLSVLFQPETAEARRAEVGLQLTYSRPVLEMTMAGKGGRLKPGEVSSMEINCINRGTNMAKSVVMMSVIPPQLELVAADPGFSLSGNGVYTWRFDELGSGEKRNIKVSYRVKAGIAVGTSMQMKNTLSYQDLLGNRY